MQKNIFIIDEIITEFFKHENNRQDEGGDESWDEDLD